MKKLFWIKWYLATWLSSETRLSTDAATRGVYRDLIDLCYLNGGIPSEREALIRMASCTPAEFDAAWPKIRHKFVQMPDRPGRITTTMVEEVLAESGYDREQKSRAGKLSAESRKRGTSDATPVEQVLRKCSNKSESELYFRKASDLDFQPANRKQRGSLPDTHAVAFPDLTEALAAYMGRRPSARTVVDVMDAGGGAAEAALVKCLGYLLNERGLRPGTKHGPRSWSWFKTTVLEYFAERRAREEVAHPRSAPELSVSDSRQARNEFERMTAAIELPDGEA